MISGQMRRWRRLHRRIGLTQPFLLQAHVKGTTETHSGLPVHHRWRPVVVYVKPARHPSDPTTAFTFVGAAISEICGSCKETPRSDYSSFLLCGVSHIMVRPRQEEVHQMQSTQSATLEGSRPESLAGNVNNPARHYRAGPARQRLAATRQSTASSSSPLTSASSASSTAANYSNGSTRLPTPPPHSGVAATASPPPSATFTSTGPSRR